MHRVGMHMVLSVAQFIAVATQCLVAASPVRSGTVAVTFNDLPVFGHYESAVEAAAITDSLSV